MIVRPGAAEARIEGRFVLDDDEFVLARVVPTDGRSRAYVNGRLATAATLADVGARLVDLHGQHAHQSLLAAATQRHALDRFGSVDLGPLRAARERLTEIDASLATFGGDARTRAREIDLLRFQVAELDAAALEDPDEDATLEALEDTLADATAHREAAASAVAMVNDDGGALDVIGSAVAALAHRAPFAELAARLRNAAVEIADTAGELRDRAESIDDDPQRLADVRARRQLLHDLQRKYGETIADVIVYHRELSEQLEKLESHDARVAALERQRADAAADESAAARAVGAARRAAAPRLAMAVQTNLAELAMPHAQVTVTVGDDEHDDPGDAVVFGLGANPGAPVLPLTKVASGGELARSMLALRLVLSEDPATLVFDEVDAGVGGAAALAIGRALAQLGDRHQVLVVTHLPQIAAMATAQIVVAKQVDGGVTTATATAVDGSTRVQEIARMLSGESDSRAALNHARELLGQRRPARAEPSSRSR